MEAAERWVAAAPDDGWGHMVLGDALVTWAWQARGGGWASTVQEDSWQIFFERLRRAEDALTTAARLLPESHLPWGRLIWSGIGLQIPLEELTVRYDEGNRRAPFDNGLVSSALQMLCAKWYGSREHMFAYARMVASEAPAGKPRHLGGGVGLHRGRGRSSTRNRHRGSAHVARGPGGRHRAA